MKLIGSKMERDFREQLIKWHDYHFSQKSKSRLKSVLIGVEVDTNRAYIVNWIPDQGEDIYLVLTDGEELFSVEIDRIDKSIIPIVEKLDLKEYKHGLKRSGQVQLLVAQDLMKKTP